jgi:ABC-type branched-subunit amino acid transport system ATPase component
MSGLQASTIRMEFGGVVALHSAAVTAHAGSVVGLIGRNGSGKSTLFNCITGFLRPTSGSVTIDGVDITGRAPNDIVRCGVARTFQTPRVDFHTTVREAVRGGAFTGVRSAFIAAALGLPGARREERELHRRCDEVIHRLDLDAWADAEIGTLSMGRVRIVEVARALAANAKYLLLDEPAAGISRDEQVVLAREIRKLSNSGIGVLLVEHNFPLIRLLCDRVTVLDAGKVIFQGTPSEVERDEQVLAVYLGSAADVPVLATEH